MENKINYQKELEKEIRIWSEQLRLPTILLQACCAPCSSYCLEYLNQFANIKIFYYNPNITDKNEYALRVSELARLIEEMPMEHKAELIEGEYEPEAFYCCVNGLEDLPEGGSRCFKCYELRLRKTAELAAKMGADYFSTTLTISPLKNAQKLNEIGLRLAKEYGVKWLPSDFKKNGGYQRSIVLSKEYGLYRQDFCGCEFSKKQAEERRRSSISK
ncbi:MAG: epoxyqueuosine reductase QueH [Lachnospiraceae bacterium]|nr:epoxyqueuosine reductase QueH [Lachnospiraceae bacterium]